MGPRPADAGEGADGTSHGAAAGAAGGDPLAGTGSVPGVRPLHASGLHLPADSGAAGWIVAAGAAGTPLWQSGPCALPPGVRARGSGGLGASAERVLLWYHRPDSPPARPAGAP